MVILSGGQTRRVCTDLAEIAARGLWGGPRAVVEISLPMDGLEADFRQSHSQGGLGDGSSGHAGPLDAPPVS